MASERPLIEGPLKLLHQIDVSSDILCCSLSESSPLYVAVGSADGIIRVFIPETGTLVFKLTAPDKGYGPVTSVSFKKRRAETANILLATYGGGFVCHWHVTSSKCLNTIREDRQTLGAASSPDGLHFSTVGSDTYVNVYNETTHQQVHCFQSSPNKSVMDGHQMRVFTVKYHPAQPRMLVTAGWDDTVQFWDLEVSHSIRHISNVHVCGDAVDINADDSTVLVGSWRSTNSLQLYDFKSCKLMKTLSFGRGKSCQLYCAKWIDQGMIACGGGSENVAKIVEKQAGRNQARISRMQHAVYSQDYFLSSQRQRLYVVTSGSLLFIYQHNFSGFVDVGDE
ncbi:POC1 centriolar protein homolog A-like [Oscarella lobularis]|uniref:POC1 centriolar protein homolog A-like n=1 Tax=Oscarella lobularis TaxID=121494 RepID=UPI00331330DE